MSEKVEAVPTGYTTITPWIIGKNTAGLMDFLERAFGAEDLGRVNGEGGVIAHAEMRIGNGVVMMFDAKPDWVATPAFIRLYVENADAVFETAVGAGAEPVTQVTHLPFGDRVGRVRDPFGNLWWVQQRVENVTEEELLLRWADPKWSEALEYVQGSELMQR